MEVKYVSQFHDCRIVYMYIHAYQLPGDPDEDTTFSKEASSHSSSCSYKELM